MEQVMENQSVEQEHIKASLEVIRKGKQAIKHGFFSGRESKNLAVFLLWLDDFTTQLEKQVKNG